jgi:hypothetical protein
MRDAFTGMLPGAIEKFETLFETLKSAGLNPRITGGYSTHGSDDDLRTWGVVCNMQCDDDAILSAEAAALGIEIRGDGSLAYTNGLTLADFKTNRVTADLTLQSQEEV